MHAATGQRLTQGSGHMVLPDDFIESLGSVAAVQGQGHRLTLRAVADVK
ncbi:unannotated protein [freshwater metagenome]|uniref:Unannotated protein n=1 Tax=freshwater metagenome TaxID=449393 RepID=A0A6J6XNF5_9ZZZZ